jgi:hypothetical protein
VVGLWGLQLFLHGVANALGGTGLGFHHFLGGVPEVAGILIALVALALFALVFSPVLFVRSSLRGSHLSAHLPV